MLSYLQEDKLTIKIFGNQDLKRKKESKKNTNQIDSSVRRPTNKSNTSGSKINTSAQGKSLGSTMNSTMNSSNSSGGNYKVQPQPVRVNPG